MTVSTVKGISAADAVCANRVRDSENPHLQIGRNHKPFRWICSSGGTYKNIMIAMKINDGNGLSLVVFFKMKKEIRNDEVFFCLLIDD